MVFKFAVLKMATQHVGKVLKHTNAYTRRLLSRCIACSGSVTKLNYCTGEQARPYPAVKPKWPPGIRGVLNPKVAWEMYEERLELENTDDAKFRLEKLSGTMKIPEFNPLTGVQTSYGLSSLSTCYMVLSRPYNMYPRTQKHHQFTTKTKVIESQLPSYFDTMEVDHIVKDIKPLVSYSLQRLFEASQTHERRLQIQLERTPEVTRRLIIGSVLNCLMSVLSTDNEHLMRSQIDENCRIEAFWKRIGYDRKKLNLNRSIWGSMEHGNIIRFQFKHQADFQIRTELPLPEIVSGEDELCYGDSVDYLYAPTKMGESVVDGRPTCVSGVWINDPCEFTSLSVHCLGPKFEEYKQFYGPAVSEFKTTTAFFTGFGSCVAQAHNQGFNWLMDIAYPFTTQTVVFDGQNLRFCSYQLNTLNLWQYDRVSKKQNIAWVSDDIQLFEGFEDGQIRGLNDEALAMLIKCLLVEPTDRGIDLRPFLPECESPRFKNKYFNHVGEEVWKEKKVGRFDYPRNSVYYYSCI